MNKNYFKSYFNYDRKDNKFADTVYKQEDNYYITNKISIIKLFDPDNFNTIENQDDGKILHNIFSNIDEEFEFLDNFNEEDNRINEELCIDLKELNKIKKLLKASTICIYNYKDRYMLRIYGKYGIGYLLPMRIY